MWKKNHKMCPQSNFAMCSADLTCVNGSTIQLVLHELLLRINLWVLNKNFQEIIYLSLLISNISSNKIVRLQAVRFLETVQIGYSPFLTELKLKCCFSTYAIELLFIFLFITYHSRILQSTNSFFHNSCPEYPARMKFMRFFILSILAEKK